MAKPQILKPGHEYAAISRDELLSRLHDRALTLVNVMPADSFKAAHIPGSLSLPVADIEARARRLLADFNRELAVYCAGPT